MKTITRKRMLYKSKVEYMSGEGEYTMNHVLGCSHGCKYPCYAYLTAKRFGQVEGYEDWCEPKLVANTLELLKRELDGHLRRLEVASARPLYLQRVGLVRGGRVLGDELLHGGTEYGTYRAVQDVASETSGPCVFGLDPDSDGWALAAHAASYEEAKSAFASMRPRIREALKPLGVKARFGGTKEPIKRVHMCFTTDPFPYPGAPDVIEDKANDLCFIHCSTMDAIDLLNRQGIPVTILTKGILPHVEHFGDGDIRLEDEGAYQPSCWTGAPHPDNEYGISLVSLNEAFRERWEPGTAPYGERIKALKDLHDAGCKTWVSMEPFPALTALGAATCCGADLRERLCNLAETWCDLGAREPLAYFGHDVERFGALVACLRAVSFTDRIVFGRWNYNDAMPADVPDVDAWYREAARLVREFCDSCGIECVIKKGTGMDGGSSKIEGEGR